MKLFVIYIGGTHEDALIELHDMRFVAGDTIEDTYSSLRKTWWGTPQSLHLDAWGTLNYADGYEIKIFREPPEEQNKKLYFLNLGGYDSTQFTELHKNVFVVAEDKDEAKAKGKEQIQNWESPHRDYQYEVDDVLNLQDPLNNVVREKLHIHLTPTDKPHDFQFIVKYVSIGKTV